jgi:predicted RND superfamily exporter protein
MFQADDPVLIDYEILKQRFGGNEVVLVVYRDREFWNPSAHGLVKQRKLHNELSKIDGIQSMMDLSILDELIRRSEPSLSAFFQSGEGVGIFSRSNSARSLLNLFAGYTHSSPEACWLAIACMLDPESLRPRSDILDAIRSTTRDYELESVRLIGEPVMIREGFDLIEADGRRLGWVSSIALAGLMLFFYRSIVWTLVTIAIVHWSLAVTRWTCVVLQWELTMISSMQVAIVTVIGIATTMHWLHHFQIERRHGQNVKQAVRLSLQSVLAPMTWSCLTDAVAFVSLLVARVEPIRDYGAMMCVASLATLTGVLCLGPGLILLLSQFFFAQAKFVSHVGNLKSSIIIVEKNVSRRNNRIPILISMMVAIVIVAIGSPKLTVETNFLKNFRSDSELVEGYEIVERELGGAGVWDAVIPAPERLTRDYLDEVQQLVDELRLLPHGSPTKIISLSEAESVSRESPLFAALPLDIRLAGMRAVMPHFFDSLLEPSSSAGLRSMRILLRAPESMSTKEKQTLIDDVRLALSRAVDRPSFRDSLGKDIPETVSSEPIVTGYYVLLPKLVESVVADQWFCLGTAAIGIGLVLWLAVGSVRLTLLAIVANTLPSLAAVAVLGLSGVPMNLGVVMIAAVSLGLSIDSSLHLLINYRRRLREGQTSEHALTETRRNIGFPILVSSISLIIGFMSLCTSQFLPTVWFGGMAAASIVLALLANLYWLPTMIEWVESK